MEAELSTVNFNNGGWYFIELESGDTSINKGGRVFYVVRNGIELWFGFLGG